MQTWTDTAILGISYEADIERRLLSVNKLDESSHAENPARDLLERLGWTYAPREMLAAERDDERDVLLGRRLRDALLRLNDWMTGSQADWVIGELEHSEGSGIARNQRVHEDLIYGKPVSTATASGRQSRVARFFDFEHPEGGLNEFVVTTQFRVRRGNERRNLVDDQRVVKPDLVLFVNGIPLVVMEAKSPSLMDVWKSKAVRQLRRYQEAAPEWHGTGAPELFHTNLLCVAHCGAAAAYATLGAPENAYVEWKSVLPYSDAEVLQRFGVEPKGQAQLIVGLLAPSTLLDILRDYVVYEPQGGKLVKKLPRYQQYRTVRAAIERLVSGRKPEERGGVVWHTQGSGKSLTMLWLATKLRRPAAPAEPDDRGGDRPQAARSADQRDIRALRVPGARAGDQHAGAAPAANQRRHADGDDDDSKVRGTRWRRLRVGWTC